MLITDHIAIPASARSLTRFVEGLTDPTVLVTRSHQISYANAEARLQFGEEKVREGNSFSQFLQSTFGETSWREVEPVLSAVLADQESEPVEVFLGNSLKQSHMRVSGFHFGQGSDGLLDAVYAATFFEPDANAPLRRLEFVLDSSTDGIFIVNRKDQIVFFNRACEKLTGWKRDASVVQTYECANVLRCHNDEGESMASDHLGPAKVFFHKDSSPRPHEMLITTSTGKERYVETNYSPITNPNGEVEFIVGIIRDIDERKRLESQVVQNRNLVMLGQLVSGIAHEIKNPLGILMSSVEIVLNENRPVEQRREAASYIKDEIRRLDDRMKDFLAFARPKPLRLEPVDVGAILRRTAASYQSSLRNKQFHVVPQMCAHTPITLADSDLLHQAFLNLIINADQSMPHGGMLTMTTETVGDRILIHFSDTGEGIRDEDMAKLFDPFFTTKAEGTGLGLSIVQQILSAHGGQITAHNNGEKTGATFVLDLPIVKVGEAN